MSAEAIKAAMSVAADLSAGTITEAEITAVAATEAEALVGTVVGPEDVLWSLQVEIARQVLARRGLSVGELTEWLAVARGRTDAGETDVSEL